MAISLIEAYNDRIKKLREKVAEEVGKSDPWRLDELESQLEKTVIARDSIKIELEKLNEN